MDIPEIPRETTTLDMWGELFSGTCLHARYITSGDSLKLHGL